MKRWWSAPVFFFNQKTAYEMRISDWSSDVCSSDLRGHGRGETNPRRADLLRVGADARADDRQADPDHPRQTARRHAASDARGEAVAVGPQAQILSVRQAAPILPRSAHGISMRAVRQAVPIRCTNPIGRAAGLTRLPNL